MCVRQGSYEWSVKSDLKASQPAACCLLPGCSTWLSQTGNQRQPPWSPQGGGAGAEIVPEPSARLHRGWRNETKQQQKADVMNSTRLCSQQRRKQVDFKTGFHGHDVQQIEEPKCRQWNKMCMLYYIYLQKHFYFYSYKS